MEGKRLTCRVTVRIFGEEKCFGPGIAELLERVETEGSLRKAAQRMEMAYSKAWTIVKTAERNLGFPVLLSATGGHGGGGASLTPEGKRFLTAYRALEAAVCDYANEAFLEGMG